jgi:hypothetical protein
MKTGIFVTAEERSQVETAYKCSGMYLSGGIPMGQPEKLVQSLVDKYKPPEGSGLNIRTGEFETP